MKKETKKSDRTKSKKKERSTSETPKKPESKWQEFLRRHNKVEEKK